MKPETVERRTENVRNKTESNDHVNNCESNVGVDKRSLESKAFVYSLLFSVRNDYLTRPLIDELFHFTNIAIVC